MITGVAYKINGQVYSLEKPMRHHNVIKMMRWTLNIPGPYHGRDSGFMTDEGEYLNRSEAAAHAIECGQIEKLNWPPYLYSEDLW